MMGRNKEELKEWFTTDNKSGYKSTKRWLIKYEHNLYDEIILNSKNYDIPLIEKISLYLLNLHEPPKCLVCGKVCRFKGSLKRGFANYCNSYCFLTSKERKENLNITYATEKHKLAVIEGNKKREETNIKTIGVKNPMLLDSVKNKQKETINKIYGVDNVFQSEIIKEKIIKTTEENYGVTHLSKIPEIHKKSVDKMKCSNMIKFHKHFANKLKISINDLDIDGDILTVRNYCNLHDNFTISKNNLNARYRGGVNICTKCYPIGENESINEQELSKFIKSITNCEVKKHKIKNKEIDVYIEEMNMGFEYDGIFWHSDKYVDNQYHLNKTLLCNETNINLHHIFDDEWLNKKEIVKSIIKSKFKHYDNEIDSDVCIIKNVDQNGAIEFLENNNIFEPINSNINIGLFNDGYLVSLMVGEYIDNNFEILRFCNKINLNIIGGFDKLLSYVISEFDPNKIISFVDRRYYNGSTYLKFGFKHIGNTEPNCYHFKRNELKRHPIISTNDIIPNSHLKIYDCGYMKFELKLQ